MLTIITRTIEFIVYHLCIVVSSRVSKIQVHESARHQDEFLRRYLAAMTEIRMLKTELIKLNGKGKKGSPYSSTPVCPGAGVYFYPWRSSLSFFLYVHHQSHRQKLGI